MNSDKLNYIYMYDASRAKDPGRPMYLRIPIEGGVVQWTYPNPLQWEDVMVVDARLENDAGDLRVTDLC